MLKELKELQKCEKKEFQLLNEEMKVVDEWDHNLLGK
jgi:hypothetical protein